MEHKFTPGVYMIVNSVTGATYVGSSARIGVRITSHRSYLNRGKHTLKRLQADWITYGEGAFSIHVLETVADKRDRAKREQYWMDALKPHCQLYNGTLIAAIGGSRISAEMKLAVSLVADGLTAYEAAKRAGVTATALRHSDGYRLLLVAGKVNIGKPGRKIKPV